MDAWQREYGNDRSHAGPLTREEIELIEWQRERARDRMYAGQAGGREETELRQWENAYGRDRFYASAGNGSVLQRSGVAVNGGGSYVVGGSGEYGGSVVYRDGVVVRVSGYCFFFFIVFHICLLIFFFVQKGEVSTAVSHLREVIEVEEEEVSNSKLLNCSRNTQIFIVILSFFFFFFSESSSWSAHSKSQSTRNRPRHTASWTSPTSSAFMRRRRRCSRAEKLRYGFEKRIDFCFQSI